MRLYANVFVTAQAIGVSIALCRKRMQWLSASTLNIFGPDSMEETMPP